jgi:Peptidase inhibitor I78 family
MKSLIAALALLSLPACATTTPAEGAAPSGACDAARAQALVGRTATPELVAQAQRLTGARRVRSIHPGMMVTMDYSPDRLNIHIGPDDRVERLVCG